MEKRKPRSILNADYFIKGSGTSGNYGHTSTPGERGGSVATPFGEMAKVLNALKEQYGEDPSKWPPEAKQKAIRAIKEVFGL